MHACMFGLFPEHQIWMENIRIRAVLIWPGGPVLPLDVKSAHISSRFVFFAIAGESVLLALASLALHD